MENVNESAPILKVEHVKKSFGDLHVLKDISFDLKAGEVLLTAAWCRSTARTW